MPSSIQRIDIAGRDVTEYMQLLFRKSGYVFHTSAEKEIVRTIKEKQSYVALDPKKEEKEWMQHGGRLEGQVVEYTLPDGHKMKVGCSNACLSVMALRGIRSVRRDIARLRYCLTLRSLDWNTQESTRSSSMQSTGQTWTFGSLCLVISCCRGAQHLLKVSETGCCMKCRDSRLKI